MNDENRAAMLFGLFLATAFLVGTVATSYPALCAAPISIEATTGKSATWCFEFWFNRYQTFVAAIIALAAAGGSMLYLRRQIRQADEQERERYLRRHAAARAVLPLSLNLICDFATSSAANLIKVLDTFGDAEASSDGIKLKKVAPPAEAIKEVREFIETLSVPEGKQIAALIAKIQIHIARLSSADNTGAERASTEYIITKHNIETYIVDAA